MNEHGRNETDIFRYTDVEYTPGGYSDVYRWDDFLGIAGGHVLSAKCIVDSVSPGGDFEGDEPEYAYACEIVGCCGLRDGVALFRPVSHGGAEQRDHGMQDPGLRRRHPHLSRFARQLCGGEARRGGTRDEGSPQRAR